MKQSFVLTFLSLLSLLFTTALNANDSKVQAQSRYQTFTLGSKRSVTQKPSAWLIAWTQWFEACTTKEEKFEAISRLSGDLSNEVWSKLIEIAGNHRDMAVRKAAIGYLAGRANDQVVRELIRLYDKETISEIRMELLSYFSGLATPESHAKIRQIARFDKDARIRGKALDYMLGR
jgi:hypothetical protein